MEYPWKVVGWEKTVSDSGTEGCRLYVEQQLQVGADGEGVACGRVWFNTEKVQYLPQLGQMIIFVTDERNRNIVNRIIVVA